jgi:hypothetical protein
MIRDANRHFSSWKLGVITWIAHRAPSTASGSSVLGEWWYINKMERFELTTRLNVISQDHWLRIKLFQRLTVRDNTGGVLSRWISTGHGVAERYEVDNIVVHPEDSTVGCTAANHKYHGVQQCFAKPVLE